MSRSSDAAIDDMNRRRGMTSESEELHTVRKQLDRAIQEVARLKTELLKAHADLDDAMILVRRMNEVMRSQREQSSGVPEIHEGD